MGYMNVIPNAANTELVIAELTHKVASGANGTTVHMRPVGMMTYMLESHRDLRLPSLQAEAQC